MFCPKCGTENPNTGKFCSHCGHTLRAATAPTAQRPPSPPTPTYYQPTKPANPLASSATIGGITGMAGGAAIVLGWLLPWSAVGLGNGLQILGLLATGGLLGGLASDVWGFLVILLAIALALVVLAIPYFGYLCARTGARLFEQRSFVDQHYINSVRMDLIQLRGRARAVLVLMFLLFVFVSVIPFFGSALLGRGYYLMVGGALVTFLGTLFARSQIGNVSPDSPIPVHATQSTELTSKEQQILDLLAEEHSNLEIANKLGIEVSDVHAVTTELMKRFGVKSKMELVRTARMRESLASKFDDF